MHIKSWEQFLAEQSALTTSPGVLDQIGEVLRAGRTPKIIDKSGTIFDINGYNDEYVSLTDVKKGIDFQFPTQELENRIAAGVVELKL